MTARPIDLERWRRPVSAAVALVLLLAMMMAAGCVASPGMKSKAYIIPEDQYIFFQHHINTNGVTVSGECSPRMMIDFPFYYFNRNKRILTVTVPKGEWVNDSLLMFYGNGESLSGMEGGGERSSAGPIYAIPQSIGDVTLDSIMADGTVIFHYHERQLSLKPGERWENITRVMETRNRPEYSKNCTAEIITTDAFYNAGLMDKKSIVLQ